MALLVITKLPLPLNCLYEVRTSLSVMNIGEEITPKFVFTSGSLSYVRLKKYAPAGSLPPVVILPIVLAVFAVSIKLL